MQTVTSAENGCTEKTDFQVPTKVEGRVALMGSDPVRGVVGLIGDEAQPKQTKASF